MPASSSRTPESAPRVRGLLLAIALLAFALRALHVAGLSGGPWFDAPPMDMGYHLEWARAVAAGEVYRPGEPFFRAPLYPWFLAACLVASGGSLVLALLVQAALGALTAVLTFHVGRRVFGPTEGLLAAAGVALSWVLIHFDGQLLLPTLLVPLTLAALLASLRLADAPTPGRAALAGLAWGLAAITRPNVLLGLPPLALWLLLWRRRDSPRGRPRWRATLALTLGTLAPILPLTAYNALATGDPALISTQGGLNLWIGNNPASDGVTAIVPGTRAGWWEGHLDARAQAEAFEGRALSATGVSRSYARRALAWMRAEPAAFTRHLAHKLRLLASSTELGNNVDPRAAALEASPWLALSPVSLAWVLPLALLGLLGLRGRVGAAAPLLVHLAAYAASIALFFVNARFRAPLVPLLMILAAHGALRLLAAWRRGERRVALGGLALAGSLGVAVAWPVREAGTGMANGRVHLALGHAQRAAAARDAGELEAAMRGEARAAELLEEALAVRPDWGPAWQALGAVRREAGEVDGALAAYERALELGAGELAVDGLLGTLLRAERRGAAELRARALRAAGSAGASYVLAVLARDAGDRPAARALAQESEDRAPGRFRAPWLLAVLAVDDGDVAAARAHLTDAERRREDATEAQRRQLTELRRRLGP